MIDNQCFNKNTIVKMILIYSKKVQLTVLTTRFKPYIITVGNKFLLHWIMIYLSFIFV